MKLRMATIDDLPALAVLGHEMHANSSYAPMDYDPERLKETIADLINKSQFVVVAEGTNGEVIGAMLGVTAQSLFGRDMVANDIALFVAGGSRGGMAAVKMAKAFVTWAKLAGAKQIRPGVSTGDERAEKLYERMGFTRCGACFVMEGV